MVQTSHKPPADLSGTTLVVGLGTTGLSCVRFLAGRGCEVRVVDSRAEPPGLEALSRGFPQVPRFLGGFDPAAFAGVARLLVSPGVAVTTPQVAEAAARGVEVMGDIELFARLTDAPVAAITGSNGKSTVTTLLGEMVAAAGVRVAVGGNLGTPALDLLSDAVELYVLELSSFQLETTSSLNARVATVLNISADHLDRYASLEDYAAAKARIFHGDGVMVVNRDDPRVAALARPQRQVIPFTLNPPEAGQFGLREGWLAWGDEPWIAAAQLQFGGGAHNVANALAALAMGQALGLDRAAMLTALRHFQGLPHRTRRVGEADGVVWYDDSKGTNVGATLAAVAGMPGPVVLIAGGDGKGQDFTPLREVLAARARGVVLIGRDGPLIAAALEGAVELQFAADMNDAVERAGQLARPGDSVLLSPACASFDMFRNYQERGAVFAACVQRRLG